MRFLSTLAFLALPHLALALPSVDEPLRTSDQAPQDSAVIVGIESYPLLGPQFGVPYAQRDLDAFENFLIYSRGVPKSRIHKLNQTVATRDEIIDQLKQAAGEAKGTLWFYFAGHGAASPETKKQVLLGVDLPQNPKHQPAHMVEIDELRAIADRSSAKDAVFIIDACHQTLGQRFAAPVALTAKSTSKTAIWTAALSICRGQRI